jgi:hypothetical protein
MLPIHRIQRKKMFMMRKSSGMIDSLQTPVYATNETNPRRDATIEDVGRINIANWPERRIMLGELNVITATA